jgi:DNA polymerase sigma
MGMKDHTALTDMHRALQATHTMPGTSQMINARVPIVTGELISGLSCDVSFLRAGDRDVGREGLQLMQQYCETYPQLRPLLLLVKAIMREAGLNKVRGGLALGQSVHHVPCKLQKGKR